MSLLSLPEPSSSSAASPPPPHHHRRRRQLSPPYPSTGLLALLAAVASSSQANASPISLSFLCPGLDDGQCQQDEPRHHHPPESAEPEHGKPRGKRARLPDRYVQDTDGLWRKSGWNLYGSSMCAGCLDMSPATPQVDNSVDTDTNTPSNVTSTAPTATNTDDIMDSLPPGWKPVRGRHNTAIILSISLSLAFFICLVMVVCILWRRIVKHAPDVEKRRHRSRRKKSPPGDDTEVMIEKAMQTRTKVLARAAARWRANARQTFRQRRIGRKAVQPNSSDEADIDPTSSHTRPIGHESLPASPTTSRRSSMSSVQTRNTAHTILSDVRLSLTEERLPGSSSAPSMSPSPPAYPHHPLPKIIRNKSDTNSSSTNSQMQSRRSSTSPPNSNTLGADQSVHITHMAHVATDDKALLARLDGLASAPEMSGSHYTSEYTAPVWQDEELADFAQLNQPDTLEALACDDRDRANADAMMFPPPPVHFPFNEKGKAAESYFGYSYHSDRPYRYGFDEGILDVEPEVGPSAPPFEPASDLSAMSPSAPSLEAEQASAPPFPIDDSDLHICEGTAAGELHNQNILQKEDFAASSENLGRMCPNDEEAASKDARDPDNDSESSP